MSAGITISSLLNFYIPLLLAWKNFTEMSTDMWVYRENKSYLLQVWLLFLSDTVKNFWVFKSLILLKYLSIFIPIFLSEFFNFHWIWMQLQCSHQIEILWQGSLRHIYLVPFMARKKISACNSAMPHLTSTNLVINHEIWDISQISLFFCGLSYIPSFSQGELRRRATFEHQVSLNCGSWIT